MEGDMDWSLGGEHPRTIIHIDMDCFYAQVEMIKEPKLQDKPLGIQQKNIVVTSNYIARDKGIQKCMLVIEAKRLCPNLILVNGEDLHKYRHASNEIHALLLNYTPKVEKLGFDENYLDVSKLVAKREMQNERPLGGVIGHVIGDVDRRCACGCNERLTIGSEIAEEIRQRLKSDLGFTSCCGVSHNKVLAKLACSRHKPNQQTTLLANGVSEFLLSLDEVSRIPGVGFRTRTNLHAIGVRTVRDLQEVPVEMLTDAVGAEQGTNLKKLSHGVDCSAVKQSGKPQTIGLEDGFKKISLESDVRQKFRVLLLRLMALVVEDGRVPVMVKVTVRKFDGARKTCHKETRQSPVPGCLFGSPVGKLSDEATTRLLAIVMGLFNRIVNITKPFHLTLLGLAFTKFEGKAGNRSIASFLLKKRDISVQSLTSFVSNENLPDVCDESVPSCSKAEPDTEPEPSSKKTKLDVLIKKRKFGEDTEDLCSPSKLKVGELSLNGDSEEVVPCGVDPTVFRELPYQVQQELLRDWRLSAISKPSKPGGKQSLIRKYCIPNN